MSILVKIIFATVVVICGVASFLARRVLSTILKHNPTEKQLIKFKMSMLAVIILCGFIIIFLNRI